MAGSQTNRPCLDGSENFPSDARPRVNLPGNQTRVNLPTRTSPHWAASPPNPYHLAAAEPPVTTLDGPFPNLGAPEPQVNLPLEHHLRGTILSNGAQGGPNTLRNDFNQGQHPSQHTSQRLNQAQERQQDTHLNRNLPSNRRFYAQDPWRGLPHLGAHPRQQDPYAGVNPSNQGPFAQNRVSFRTPGPHRQLYNANGGLHSGQNRRFQAQNLSGDVQAQADYLDTLAFEQIPKVEIGHEEFAEKQALRSCLEQVCRKTVFDLETAHGDPNFVADSVELKCFGSLTTTFATKSSDMDLVIVSPFSKHVPSAPESEMPRSIEKALLDLGYGARLLTKTRVPIIKFCEKPGPELANLLLEERLKWEKERDTPPKSPKKKERKKAKKQRKTGWIPLHIRIDLTTPRTTAKSRALTLMTVTNLQENQLQLCRISRVKPRLCQTMRDNLTRKRKINGTTRRHRWRRKGQIPVYWPSLKRNLPDYIGLRCLRDGTNLQNAGLSTLSFRQLKGMVPQSTSKWPDPGCKSCQM